jgi:biopolymer transport protein ExbD
MASRLESDETESTELHEINVTPFIDVMLVLLIIFMVAAPLSTVDIGVDLPVSTAKSTPRPDKPIFLTIKADQTLVLGEEPVASERLGQALDVAMQGDREKRLFLRADKRVAYGELMRVMNMLRGAGYLKVALVGLEGSDPLTRPDPSSATPHP